MYLTLIVYFWKLYGNIVSENIRRNSEVGTCDLTSEGANAWKMSSTFVTREILLFSSHLY